MRAPEPRSSAVIPVPHCPDMTVQESGYWPFKVGGVHPPSGASATLFTPSSSVTDAPHLQTKVVRTGGNCAMGLWWPQRRPRGRSSWRDIKRGSVKWVVRRAATTTQNRSFRLHRRRKTPLLVVLINSTKQGRQFLDCFTRPLAWPKQIVTMPSRWPRSFPISSEWLKIGSPIWRLRLALIRREPTAPSSGYTECTPRLRIDFSGKTTAVREPLNAGRALTVRAERA